MVLVERYLALGGVRLNVGCIPSKALLHVAKVIAEAAALAGPRRFLRRAQDRPGGPARLEKRGGEAAHRRPRHHGQAAQGRGGHGQGAARLGPNSGWRSRRDGGSKKIIAFEKAILATGSRAVKLPGFPDDPRLIDSTGALELEDVPGRLLVIGGGIIGLEMATVYHALGSKVTVVELLDILMPGADPDLVRPFRKKIEARYEKILLKTKVAKVEAAAEGLRAFFQNADGSDAGSELYDRILVAVGRIPNGKEIGAENAGVAVDAKGFIAADRQLRTNVPHIFAIGDLVGQPMLAHKAMHEAKVAAEAAAGEKSFFDARVIPSVAYTDPEVAWVGLTEEQAKAQGVKYGKGSFPWVASGRALASQSEEGLTKLIFDEASGKLLGAGIVGNHAGDLIAEAAPGDRDGLRRRRRRPHHPSPPHLSESVGLAAEAFEGTITDLYLPKKPRRHGA